MAFFIPLTCITLSQFYSVTCLVFFTKSNKLWNDRKEDFLYIWLLQRIYTKGGSKNSKSKNKKLHFELLTQSQKIRKFTSSY